MAKKLLKNYVFEPGISYTNNLFPNAVALLTANKSFLQAQVVAFINYNIANNIAPYVGYTYAFQKCIRDVGFFIDAVIHDLRYGGNVQTRQISQYFWIDGLPMIRGDVAPEITGQQYLRDLINNFIFTNTTVTPTYGQTALTQIKYSTAAGENGAAARNTTLWNIFGDVITNGTPNIPGKIAGVSAIKLMGRYEPADVLLITDTNSGNILYNFADTSNTITFYYKTGRISSNNELLPDLDFPAWSQKTDTITTIYLSDDTSDLQSATDIQILVEEAHQTIRPWDFGTDAIERMRVATPQAMLDADFEYGLQPTKWQAIGLIRSYPSTYEVPGTDLIVSTMKTDASVNTGNFGSSKITITTSGSHGFIQGQPITIKGLDAQVNGFSRAEGTFLVSEVPNPKEFSYFSSARVGLAAGESLLTSFIQIREAEFFTGADIGQPSFSVVSNGSNANVTSKFLTLEGSFQIAFDGTAPTAGSPVSGSVNIPPGTAVAGVTGAGTVAVNFSQDVLATDTQVIFTDYAGVLQGMALDNGAGTAIFINSISNGISSLSGAIGQSFNGSNGETLSVTGTNIQGIGTGALFNVSRSAGAYAVFDADDSSSNGSNYQIGDYILILGTALGGLSPANDLLIKVISIDSGGAITGVSFQGSAVSGGQTYTSVQQNSTTGTGTNARISVVRAGGTGLYTITLATGGGTHSPGDIVTWVGTDFGGDSPANDIAIQVDGVSFPAAAIVDFTILSGIGASGNADYAQPASANFTLTGSGSLFDVVRLNGFYTAAISNVVGSGGSDYLQDSRILILGNVLGGSTPANDCVLSLSSVGTGAVLTVAASGTPFPGDGTSVFPAMSINEPLTGDLLDGTVLNVGAIATLEVEFTSNHGLVPGTTILANITSTPTPEFNSVLTALPSSGTWSAVAFASGTFVAVRSGSNLTARSIDGFLWAQGGVLPASTTWTSVAGGLINDSTVFVAVASGGTAAAYSLNNGTTWVAATLPSSGTWNDVAYYDGVFVAVRAGSTAAAYSTNGTTWSASVLPSSSTWTSVTGGNIASSIYWIAVASGTNAAAYSINGGQSWVAFTLPTNTTWSAVQYGNNRFLAVATGTTNAAVSINGLAWTAATLPVSAAWTSIAYGDDNFVVIASGTTTALTSFTGQTGTYTTRTLVASATWSSIAFGSYTGLGTFAAVGNTTSALDIDLTSANHQLAAGPFVINQVPTSTTFRYPARTTGIIATGAAELTGEIYARPDSFFVHRPFDGGVQLGTGSPVHGAQAVRQSKKYIRYQSGKGIMYTTGGLFAPSYNLSSATAVDFPVNSFITFTCDDTDHGLQSGAEVEIIGANDFEYNGDYVVESIVDARSFRVRAGVVLSTLNASLGVDCKVVLKYWHGSIVKIGAFDEQNGIYYQYDGRRMSVVKRSSTNQLAGVVALNQDVNVVTGTNTKLQDQLRVGDRVVIRGMSHTVTGISSQTSMTISPDWRGASDITGARMCVTQDLIIPAEDWNIDPFDGSGQSGYELLPWRMQMLGIQYSWYAAGFIEFMMRGADGRFIFLHKIRNSNVNTEAYMRTANLPVRYEVENIGGKSQLMATINSSQASLRIRNAYDFPNSGVLYIDNELISYANKSGNTLSGLTRSTSMLAFVSGQNRIFTAGPAASHTIGVGVEIVSCTATPTISHWGSALLTDGQFDEDRGYLFSYVATSLSISTTKQTAFLIRLAPSVSNAIVGDLGERDLLNRAQLLLQSVEVAVDSGNGSIVVEGVLNPQNYPVNPSDIGWQALTGLAGGGQPSFAQIASGGSVSWNGGAGLTTASATTVAQTDANVTVPSSNSFNRGTGTNFFFVTDTSWNASYASVGTLIADVKYPAGTTITGVAGPSSFSGFTYYRINTSNNSLAPINNSNNVTLRLPSPPSAATNVLYFTQSSWDSLGANVGTEVNDPTKFPANTRVQAISVLSRFANLFYYQVTFTQTSTASVAASSAVAFSFGQPPFALPGETVFSFISQPGGREFLPLTDLKELTASTLGGRGAFPNGPDVLAINVYKTAGTALSGSVILRWSEAQA